MVCNLTLHFSLSRIIWLCCLSVTNPNNPTGRILSEEEMDAVVAAARRADAWILADEVLRLLQHSLRLSHVVLLWQC